MSEALIKPGPTGALMSRETPPVYRYVLWRRWGDPNLPLSEMVAFIGLNPSTADEETDDHTIRKCCGFAQRLGYGGMVMLNLFAFRATKPADLKRSAAPYGGPLNNTAICHTATLAAVTVCCWGAQGVHRGAGVRTQRMLESYAEIHHLGLTKYGHPKHPLVLPYDTPLTKWETDDE